MGLTPSLSPMFSKKNCQVVKAYPLDAHSMPKPSRPLLLEALRYAEQHREMTERSIASQRQVVAELEASGDSAAPAARALLASMRHAHRGHVADCERIRGSLRKLPE
jgi:hypothetical protein